ncbi:MAG TPA: MG2 domain-containing protein, partial [Candidatus Angelobacter sp.]
MQRARWFVLASVLCACAGWTAEKPSLRLDEDNIRIRLLPAPLLELPVVNSAGKPLEGSFRLEFLDRDGKSAAWTTGTFHEGPGSTVEKIPWDADKLPSNVPSDLVWYRLRYEFTPNAASGVAPATGTVQVGRVLRDTFELRMTAASRAVPGAKYPVRVRVDDPKNGRPMAGVPVEVNLDIEGDDAAVKRNVVTNSAGYATATLNLPNTVESNELRVYATAMRGPFQEETYIDVKLPQGNRLTLSTDKPLYQPGQTAHMRATVFGANKHALAGTPVKFTIEDEESEEQFHQTVTTSRFGIASADWEIPQKLRLGDYRIKAAIGDEDYGQQASIRISRYDLPSYSVVVTPDRPYFLPGQDANVEVRADYLFGKPVQHAKVRVVRRNEWNWNYHDQKWEGEETQPVEGQLNASGKFMAHVSLKEDFEDFKPSRWRRFRDLDLAAYVTDLSTGRTEQRRFQLRLSALPIHLYVLNSGTGSADAPLVLYLTSSYADGTPASVDGSIVSFLPNYQDECDEQDADHRVTVARFHTNQFGVGRVEMRPLPRELLVVPKWWRLYHSAGSENQRSGCLLLEAADRKGKRGTDIEGLSFELGQAFINVQTDHALYRAGAPIAVSIVCNTSVREAVVDLSGATGLLVSEVVHLDHGRAQVTFPYDPRFHGQLDVTAFAITGSEEENSNLKGERHVLFPGRQELQLMLRMAKATFRPGEEAAADVGVRSPEGVPVESALGVLVYDRAVAERVRTDQQFGREYGFNIYDFLDYYYGQGIAGITYRDLAAWDSTKPFPEGLDLVAEAMLAYSGRSEAEGSAEFTGSGSYHDRGSHSVFENLIFHTTTPISEALKKEYKASDRYPHDAAGLKEILKTHGLDFNTTLDPWEVPYRAEFSVSGQNDVFTLLSNGPDKRPGTEDDFTVLTLGWPYFRPVGKLMNEAVFAYQHETGKYIRDYPTLRDEMKKRGADLDALRDPWGRPYRFTFSIAGAYYNTCVTSAGPDGIFSSPKCAQFSDDADDVEEWSVSIHYFANETAAIEQALAVHYAKTGVFPKSELEFKTVLDEAKLTPEQLLDPWGQPYHFSFTERSRYSDQINIQTQTVYGQEPRSVTKVTPVTQKVAYIEVVSDGEKVDQPAQIMVAEFSRVTAEQDAKSMTAMPTPKQLPVAGGHGTIRGTLTDSSGAVIQNATVSLTSDRDVPYTTTTDNEGSYEFTGLPTGFYQLKAEARGFQAGTVLRIPVQQGIVTEVNVKLQVGASSSTVEVTAGAFMVETTSMQSSSRVVPGQTEHAAQAPMFTPRLRKYFPETLLWRPEVITDKHGHAHFNFTMADNITAWSMSIVATNEAGQAGIARKELRTFLPFFLEHDPP